MLVMEVVYLGGALSNALNKGCAGEITAEHGQALCARSFAPLRQRRQRVAIFAHRHGYKNPTTPAGTRRPSHVSRHKDRAVVLLLSSLSLSLSLSLSRSMRGEDGPASTAPLAAWASPIW
jgi:hypothetical protein